MAAPEKGPFIGRKFNAIMAGSACKTKLLPTEVTLSDRGRKILVPSLAKDVPSFATASHNNSAGSLSFTSAAAIQWIKEITVIMRHMRPM